MPIGICLSFSLLDLPLTHQVGICMTVSYAYIFLCMWELLTSETFVFRHYTSFGNEKKKGETLVSFFPFCLMLISVIFEKLTDRLVCVALMVCSGENSA